MLELSDSTLAFGKLALIFGGILVMLRFHFDLWKAILAGCALLALLSGLPLLDWVKIPLQTAVQPDLLILEAMIFGILILSGVQGANGQSRRLVENIERFIRWPRIRLVIFPAMVGFLPMPGGALFSCPMLDAAAHGLNLSPRRKALINYWFRHIWEVSWPLYPGYVLASSLLGLPLLSLLKYTFPLVLMSFATGWFFLIRDIEVPAGSEATQRSKEESRRALRAILYDSLPLLLTLGGAALFGLLLSLLAPEAPSQLAFVFSVTLGVCTALYQGRGKLGTSLRKLVFNTALAKLLLVIFAIFVFKDLLGASGIIAEISHLGSSKPMIIALFILLPLFCGLLTGIMVGYVGACFPILLGILAESGLGAYTLPLVIMALAAGNAGMLFTPLHVCLVVTCEYFKVSFAAIWRKLIRPCLLVVCYGICWAALLYAFGASFK